MSDILKFTFTNKRRIHEIDDSLEKLAHAVNNSNDINFQSDFESSIITAKIKRERVRALTSIARSQVILAELEIVIAETDLLSDIQRLKNIKKTKFDTNPDTFQHSTPITSIHNSPQRAAVPSTSTDNSSQTKKKQSSKKHNIDLDDTVLIPAFERGKSGAVVEKSQSTPPVNKQLVKVTSDSEISLTSSINAEFNNSYSRSHTPDIKDKAPSKVNKERSKISSKGKSIKKNECLSISAKTEAEANKNLFHKQSRDLQLPSTPTQKIREPKSDIKTVSTCTYVPVSHNLPLIISQANMNNANNPRPGTSMMNPYLYVSTSMSQTRLHQTPSKNNSEIFKFGYNQ